jgi:HSP90 family molecular chaperone
VIEKISFWQDLGDSLAVIHTPDGQPTSQMTRMMKSMGQPIPTVKKSLILNPKNTLVQKYMSLYDSNPELENIILFVWYAYEQALLLDWSEIESMNNFLLKASKLMN